MAVLEMRRISISGLKKDKKSILNKLQALGMVEVDISEREAALGETEDMSEERHMCEKKIALSEQALKLIGEYNPEKAGIFASFEGKNLIEREELDRDLSKGTTEEDAEKILAYAKEISEKKAEKIRAESEIETLEPWKNLDINMDFKGTEHTSFFMGQMPAGTGEEKIYSLLAEKAPGVEAFDISILNSDEDAVNIGVIVLHEDEKVVEDALRAGGFARVGFSYDDTPKAVKEELLQVIDEAEKRTEELGNAISSYGDKRQDFKMMGDYYRLKEEELNISKMLPQSPNTFVVSGYVPEKHTRCLKDAFETRFECVVDIDDVDTEKEDVPTVLENNKFSETAEGVLESYGLPQHGAADPTTIMSFFYVFFFGMMLSDAAYGAIIAISCFVLSHHYPKMPKSTGKMIRLFGWCGLSTVFWGVMFGGYFGDVVTVFAKTFLNKDVVIPAVWFTPLNDPMKLLMWSMLFGTIHLFAGLAIKGYELLKSGDYIGFISDIVFWYLLLIGLILMLLPTELFYSISQIKFGFPPLLRQISKWMAIVGAVGILLMSGRSHKNPVLRIALGAYDLYNITGWLSDVLSYSRLLALGLATGVIASVVNQMGAMVGGGFAGAIIFFLIFIVGHIMNMGINILGAYVHTNRLQFVEFFGKFYEAGGRPFKPFEQNTKYLEIKEDI
jgi:V/A-type H+-transporting ATPase subunit I